MSRLVILVATLWLLPALQGQPGIEPKGGNRSIQVIRTVEPVFPLEMKQAGVLEGQARFAVLVDADGRLVDGLVTAYTHAAFAREAIEALNKWRFVAARRSGQPVPARVELQILFKRTGRVESVDGLQHLQDQFKTSPGDRDVRAVVAQEVELDEPLRLEKRVEPPWPAEIASDRSEARVTLDFYIDGYGRPRLITVVNSDGEAFSRAAMLTLMQWRYQAPLRGGQAVNVQATQEFVFARN
jgi:periplasmic protein TonB